MILMQLQIKSGYDQSADTNTSELINNMSSVNIKNGMKFTKECISYTI